MSETTLCDARMRDNDGAWCCIRVKHEGREHQWAPDTSFLAEMAGRIREVNEQFGDAVVVSTQETHPESREFVCACGRHFLATSFRGLAPDLSPAQETDPE